jgi:hypothetical protein
MLIQEGKKALNRDIVVAMSNVKEDVDDSIGAWDKEQVPANATFPSISA